MGGSQSKDAELAALSATLSSEKARARTLQASKQQLEEQLAATARELASSREAAEAAASDGAAKLSAAQASAAEAAKRQQLAEELRRSDALLAKRLMHAQLRQLGGEAPAAGGGVDGLAAAQLALAAQDEMQLRQMLMHTAGELETSQARSLELERAARSHSRSALSAELWEPGLCDASVALRSSSLMVLAGVRMPRPSAPGVRGTGLSPALAVLRQFGEPAGGGRWAALGGSLRWDAREAEVAALRVALSAQPTASERVAVSFDHTGGLTGSVKTTRDGVSARVFGTVDVNRAGASRAGVEVLYDLD